MNTRPKKTGGLAANPLLVKTEREVSQSSAPAESDRLDAREPVDMQTRLQADTPTTKFTFYFTNEQLDRLDDVWEQLRRGTRRSGQRLTKSHVVRVALERLLDEYDHDPDKVVALLKQQLQR